MYALFRQNFQALLFPLIILAVLILMGFVGGVKRLTKKYPGQSKRVLVWLHTYGRLSIYLAGFVWAAAIILYYQTTVSVPALAITFIMRGFAFTALGLLFSVYIPTLMLTYLPGFPLNGAVFHTRRALGLLTMGFACVHGSMEFFVTFNASFATIFALPTYYQLSLLLSTLAGTILVIMGMTSFDTIQQKMGKWWKRLHRCVYLVSLLVLFHAFLIGSEFNKKNSIIPILVVVAAFAILFLKVGEGFKKIKTKPWSQGKRVWSFAGLILILLSGLYLVIVAFERTNGQLH